MCQKIRNDGRRRQHMLKIVQHEECFFPLEKLVKRRRQGCVSELMHTKRIRHRRDHAFHPLGEVNRCAAGTVNSSASRKEACMDHHLRESRVDGALVFDGDFIKVQKDTVALPDGSQSEREFIRHPGAVVILPILLVFALLQRYIVAGLTQGSVTG